MRRFATGMAAALALVFASAQAAHAQAMPYSEGGPPVLLSAATSGFSGTLREGAGIPLDARVTGAEVQIRGGAEPGERLRFTRQLGVSTGTYDSGTGILTLKGRATFTRYLTALGSVWYQHHGDTPSRARTISIQLRRRGGRWTRPVRFGIAVLPVNDAPQLAAPSAGFAYSLGGGPQPIAPEIAVLDPDTRIAAATVQITSNFSSEEDALLFENTRGITGTYDSGTGILTLTGMRPARHYQAALRSVAFNTSSAQPSTWTITFRLVDSLGAEAPQPWVVAVESS